MARHLTLVATTVAVVLAWQVSAQTPRPAQVVPPAKPLPAFTHFQNWIQLSKTHLVGQVDDAVRRLAAWRLDEVRAIDRDLEAVQFLLEDEHADDASARTGGRALGLKDMAALFDLPSDLFVANGRPMTAAAIRKPDSAPRQAIARILFRAAMMHTDFLTAGSRDDLSRAPSLSGPASGPTVRLNDAERRSVPDVGVYWSCARTAIEIATPAATSSTLMRDWYVATAEYFLTERDYAAGLPHLEHARFVLPGDARIAMYLGAAYENLASPPIQAAFQNGGSAMAPGSRPTLLRKAEYQLRSALLLDPDLTDAALRLGRVLLLMARPDEALPMLARAEPGLSREESKYFAALFGGFAHAALGQTTEARAAFGRASALFPDAQSPRLGEAQVSMLSAKRDDALASINTISAHRNAKSDPWWTYDNDLASSYLEHLSSVRVSILERLR